LIFTPESGSGSNENDVQLGADRITEQKKRPVSSGKVGTYRLYSAANFSALFGQLKADVSRIQTAQQIILDTIASNSTPFLLIESIVEK
jgi:hypothetical protein